MIMPDNQPATIMLIHTFQLALERLNAGRLIDAETLCRQMLEISPDNPDVVHMQGVIAYRAKMYDVATELFSWVVGTNPNFSQAHFNLGNALRELGMQDEAIISYQNAIVLNPAYAKAYTYLGEVLHEQGRLTESATCFNKALSVDPDGGGNLYGKWLGVLQELGTLHEPMTASQLHEVLESFVDHCIRNPFASTSVLHESFSGLLANQPGADAHLPAHAGNIHDKNRIALFNAECRVEALGRERFLAKVNKLVEIAALEPSASCEVFRFEDMPSELPYPDSLSIQPDCVESLQGRQAPSRRHSVVALSEARVCVSNLGFAVFDADDNFINDVCWGDGVLFSLADPAILPPLQSYDGTVVPLCGVWGDEYFHWVLEVLPRLLLILKAGYRLDEIDMFLVGRKSAHLMEFLQILGIREERIMDWRSLPHLRARRLVFTSSTVNYDFSQPLPSILIEPWISQGLHQTYAIACSIRRTRRIYIDREAARYRKVANNAAVKQLLARYGFEFHCLESMSLEEKCTLFSCAEMIVGPAGAGFSNLVLCNEGAKVLIFYQEDFATDSFWSICNNNGLRHFHLLCKAADESGLLKQSQPALNDDLLVDIGDLEMSVELMLGDIPASEGKH